MSYDDLDPAKTDGPPLYDDELPKTGPNTRRPAIGLMAIVLIALVVLGAAAVAVVTLHYMTGRSSTDEPVQAERVDDNRNVEIIHPVVDGVTITCVLYADPGYNRSVDCDWPPQ